jgi:hypothetical protein
MSDTVDVLAKYRTPPSSKEDMRRYRANKECSIQMARVMLREERKIKVKENLTMALGDYNNSPAEHGEYFLAAIIGELLEIV